MTHQKHPRMAPPFFVDADTFIAQRVQQRWISDYDVAEGRVALPDVGGLRAVLEVFALHDCISIYTVDDACLDAEWSCFVGPTPCRVRMYHFDTGIGAVTAVGVARRTSRMTLDEAEVCISHASSKVAATVALTAIRELMAGNQGQQ